jgi:putative transposase
MYNSNIVYHIYNQSNNYESLFKSEENYRYFTRKMRRHLSLHADLLAYCLMPDHFHWLLIPTPLGCLPSRSKRYLKIDEPPNAVAYQQNLSSAIKTLLSSYTQAVNKSLKRRGSLFKSQTKIKAGYELLSEDQDVRSDPNPFTLEIGYLTTCFHYIHNNPPRKHLVRDALEWEFSSALDYAGFREESLVNFELAKHLLGISREKPYNRPTV